MTPSNRVAGAVGRDELVRVMETELGADVLLPSDQWACRQGEPIPTVAPASLETLAECLRVAAGQGARVLPAGAGTWLEAGGEIAADAVVSTRRLARLLSFEPDDLVATVEAGVPVSSLGPALAEGNEWWPVDPLGARATVGATIATGSSGPLATGHGWVRDHVLGLTVALADGRIVRPGGRGGRVVKNVAGYDLTRLFTGSWGTLGVVAEAHLRLSPRPGSDATAAIFAETPEALLTLARTLDVAPLRPSACELLSPSAAGPLGVEATRWQLWVRWLGSGAAVSEAIEGARGAADETGARVEVSEARSRGWERVAEIEDEVDARVALRWQGLPTALARGIALTRALLGGQTPAVLGAPSLGRLWVFVSSTTWRAASPRVWADRLARFQKEAERHGAWLVVERAPQEALAGIDPWGDPGPAVRILRGLKQAFDPRGVLAPGRFGWA